MECYNTSMKIFYDKRQTVQSNKSFSPSAGKPALVVDAWRKKWPSLYVDIFEPVTRDDFKMVHDSIMVDAVLDCRRNNGFSNKLPEVAESLPWTTGSLVAATLYALRTGKAGVSPTSGFHHAEWNSPQGFCTFNGLMVAAVKAQEAGAARVGVLDLDAHYGNGTDNITKHLHAHDWLSHYTYGRWSVTPENAENWLRDLPEIVKGHFEGCDVVIFQAGADPHINDPLGGDLTTEQMQRRDRIVFQTLKELGVPVAWNLAGGYQPNIDDVIQIHVNTMAECLAVNGD